MSKYFPGIHLLESKELGIMKRMVLHVHSGSRRKLNNLNSVSSLFPDFRFLDKDDDCIEGG